MQHQLSSSYYRAPEKAALSLASILIIGAVAYAIYKSK